MSVASSSSSDHEGPYKVEKRKEESMFPKHADSRMALASSDIVIGNFKKDVCVVGGQEDKPRKSDTLSKIRYIFV